MQRLALVALLLVPSFTLADSSNGQFFFSPAIFYNSDTQEQAAKADTSNILIDLRAGINVGPGIFVGLLYGIDNKNVKTSGYNLAALNYDNKYERSSYGPFVGYFHENFFAMLAYHYKSQWKVKTTGSTSADITYDGTGIQLDLGFKFPLWGFQIGPMVSYKIFTYTKTSGTTNETLNPSFKQNKLDPSLAAWIFF